MRPSKVVEGDQLIEVSGSRVVCVRQAGDPFGYPIFLFHGTPGSRMFLSDDSDARELGLRLLLPDRPGYGHSSIHRGGTLKSWAEDVERVADSLGLRDFVVAGVSGGGQYAAACAWALPLRVRQAHLICSTAPIVPGETKKWPLPARLKFELPRRTPRLVKFDLAVFAWFARHAPGLFAKIRFEQGGADRSASSRRRDQLASLLRESFRQGGEGVFNDLHASSCDWGFDPREIRVPTHVWHGRQDLMAPFALGERLVQTIPNAIPHFFSELGHLLLSDRRVARGWLECVATIP